MSHHTNQPRRVERQDSEHQTSRDAQRTDRDQQWSDWADRRRS